MSTVLSATDQKSMVAAFLEIAVGETAVTATHFLQAAWWNLEQALYLFYVGNNEGPTASSPYVPPPKDNHHMPDYDKSLWSDNDIGYENMEEDDEIEVRAPIPVKTDVLYDTPTVYESSRPECDGVWEADDGATSITDMSRDNLASLYHPPVSLMFKGSFDNAKDVAKDQDKWLIVNLQSTKEFSSHTLNRDTWGNQVVAQTITFNYIFWQVCDDTDEGRKIATFYKLVSFPVTLVVDPITGQKMRLWHGMIEPENLLEDLSQFMDGSPKDYHSRLANKRSREIYQASPPKAQGGDLLKDSDATSTKKEKRRYPPLPEEAKGDKNLLCRIGVRLPDGRRLQRNFLRSEPIQLLWSFCYANLEGADERLIRLTHAIPGALRDLDFNSNLTFDKSGLPNSMISVTWD